MDNDDYQYHFIVSISTQWNAWGTLDRAEAVVRLRNEGLQPASASEVGQL